MLRILLYTELVHFGDCSEEEKEEGFLTWIWEKPGKAGLLVPACVDLIDSKEQQSSEPDIMEIEASLFSE